jgi:ribosomal protein S18 acetylase RimI-like enzyme
VKQATLLVAESNANARALYEKMGFADTSAFLAGTLVL